MSNPFVKILEDKRKQWRQDHPFGFVARPIKLRDGTLDLFEWQCIFVGPRDSIWSEGEYTLNIKFPRDQRQRMSIYFDPPIFHPNVDRLNGRVCSSITTMWPKVGIKQILLTMQSFLDTPNPIAPENAAAAHLYETNYAGYEQRVRRDIAQNHRTMRKA